MSDVRNMKDIEHHPTLGKAGLGAFIKIECTWKVHYLLFPSRNQMNLFKEKVELFVSKSLGSFYFFLRFWILTVLAYICINM